ncbi:1-aminocyclopropane-1-carboxylate oxidase homolog 1-like [Pyrus x bretschneideri]|uniref:1-aminocyclopropane-1-carboxylate oxidase homolog 1-like n=1 Tax=Pyrus x bretschneideri TaxID=225117 RepID=UPI00202E2540|nr:1-aminocyclopropane-1-carboxylate oxidase homolog 1-like [Pyrus x bretschneideri]
MEDESSYYDRTKEVEFNETKTGVKGLVDSGITKVPKFLIHPPHSLSNSETTDVDFKVPVIDFDGFDQDFWRAQTVKEIREASETWGFFQMVNHGVPERVIENLLEVIRGFHEQPKELKMEWYLAKQTVQSLLSKALGLSTDFLENIECMKTEHLVCHYYPSCPEPELTPGTTKHSDPSSLTVLLQDNLGGLQVLHQGHWVDVPPTHGALVANVGDLTQLITNDKFRSVEHRVLAGRVGPRISAACFIYPSATKRFKPMAQSRGFSLTTYLQTGKHTLDSILLITD